ncbi:sensor histidine kinase [Oceanobacillus sp. CAU 1775]
MIKKNSIFSRMFLSYSFIIILSFLFFIAVFFYLFHVNLYKDYEEIYEHQYFQIERQLENKQNHNWTPDETAEILSYAFNQPGYHIYLVNEAGEQILGPNVEVAFLPLPTDIITLVNAGEEVSGGSFEDGEFRYMIARPIDASLSGVTQPIMVMIFYELNHEYSRVILMTVFTSLIAILFAGVILWFMSKKITAPLREMSDTARRYAKGDFSTSVQYRGDDEVGQLAKSFNYMADELHHLETRRRQYISNVSHELRSPLTSIKGFITAFMDETIPKEKEIHYYGLMKDETERMIKLVNDTLDMNQLEEGHGILMLTSYNLTEQIQAIIQKFEPHCKEKQLKLRLHTDRERDYIVYADKERMEQVIVNLIHNAVQFSKQEGKIDIKLIRIDQHVQVQIKDDGIGMKEEHLDLIWKRFYKVDEARSSKSGAGLGLAIVKSILDLHEAEVKVETTLGKGTTFSFKLLLHQ